MIRALEQKAIVRPSGENFILQGQTWKGIFSTSLFSEPEDTSQKRMVLSYDQETTYAPLSSNSKPLIPLACPFATCNSPREDTSHIRTL